jgi:uncharacterized protein (DUF885 family)
MTMHRTVRAALLTGAMTLAWGMAAAAQTAAAPPAAAQAAPASANSAELARVIADFEAYDRREDPFTSGLEGDQAALSRLPGITPADDARRKAALEQFKARLARVSDQGLNEADRLNLVFLRRVVDDRLEGLSFDSGRLAYSNEGGPEQFFSYIGSSTRIRNRADADAYLARLEAMAKLTADSTANMRRGIKSGWVPSRTTTEVALPLMKAQAGAPVTDEGGLMEPLARLPDNIPAADQKALRARARSIIEARILPAQREFVRVVETEALPAAKPKIGDLYLPNGKAYYAYLARSFTTTNQTPDQLHALGLKEVARIRAEMAKEMAAAGFKGTFPEFLNFLRTDPRFYATSREDLMEKSARIAKRADDELPKIFGKLPRLPYGVREVPREIEENYTTARYNGGSPQLGIAGGLMVNTSHLDQRPLYEHPALMLHEGVPGHHLQIAIQQELGEEPWFRRQAGVTAFVEGWGLYSEFLGYDINAYRDPYERFGKLSMEMWRACRLVADTGIHWKGWSIEQARACFTENSALAPKNIENELQRYIAGGGQALAYKVGELKLRELRGRAKAELGDKFDLRRFHDAVLWGGPLPLDLLEGRINAWIAAEKARS